MISCDMCEDWFHFECVGLERISTAELEQKFFCPDCSKKVEKGTDGI